MKLLMIPFGLLGLTVLEFYLLFKAATFVGFFPVIGLTLLTALIGGLILRIQGIQAVNNLRKTVTQGRVPVEEISHGAILIIAVPFLMTPGFLTDAMGFALLVPGLRRFIARRFLRWIKKQTDRGTITVTTIDHDE